MKKRLIKCRFGNMDWIEIPNDWRKAEGINAKRTETNMGLAQRDYSKKCKIGSEPLMVVEGFWLWWCFTHNQPEKWCSENRLKIGFCESLDKLKKEQEKN